MCEILVLSWLEMVFFFILVLFSMLLFGIWVVYVNLIFFMEVYLLID